jgi:carboxyl-terminal processing protease
VAATPGAPARAAPPDMLSAADYQADARDLGPLIEANYAYLPDLPDGQLPSSSALIAERDAVHDRDSLLRYAEDVLTTLADHHALTGSSFKDDWAIVPSYADIWIVHDARGYAVDAVRQDSPAMRAGIRRGDRLRAVDSVPVDDAVTAFWARLGLAAGGARDAYAARVLVAGRRDRPRHLAIAGPDGRVRNIDLPSLYDSHTDPVPVTVASATGSSVRIRFNNALGDNATIAAFDAAMAVLPPHAPVEIDLTDTPSGGNTTVARAIMGWFVTAAMPYQMHRLPSEERATGIARQWIEEVLPRAGKSHPGPVSVRVGRWTGSVGEGLAIGFAALSKPVCGGAMAGLKGAVDDFELSRSHLRVKFPTEQLFTVTGQPRETVVMPLCENGG